MNATKIILVRHGESLGNAVRMLLGHTDLDLSTLGYKQAEATARALDEEQIDVIYSSDLKRAFNTAKQIADRRNILVINSRELREVCLGDWEGMKVDEVIDKYGQMYEADWLSGFGTFHFPGGESTKDAGERFYNEVERIAKENDGKTILIAAHAAVIRAFVAKVLEIPAEEIAEKLPFPTNASYSEVYYDIIAGKFRAGKFSVDDHLADIGITKFK